VSEIHVHPVSDDLKGKTHLDLAGYRRMYDESVNSPTTFWPRMASEFLDWISPWTTLYEGDMKKGETAWFIGGKLNVSLNCIDRHLPARANQVAILWEGDEPGTQRKITYQELHDEVCRLANVLRRRGVKKGDRICIYMPMVPEAAFAMLACARLGAIHSVVFGGFSPESLKDRILDSDCRTVITADEGVRGGKYIPLKANTDAALLKCPNVSTVIVIRRTGNPINWHAGRDLWYHETTAQEAANCPA
jgi:acetyl-CoA synthetase